VRDGDVVGDSEAIAPPASLIVLLDFQGIPGMLPRLPGPHLCPGWMHSATMIVVAA
jgi:hypothetical protein